MGQLQNRQRPRTNNNNNRSGNIRNSNLATLASEARSFKGKIGELPIIGRQYESAGVAFDVLRKAVSDYSVLNLENGDHMVYGIEKRTARITRRTVESEKLQYGISQTRITMVNR